MEKHRRWRNICQRHIGRLAYLQKLKEFLIKYFVIKLVTKFNFPVCRLDKTVSRAGPHNVMFGNRSKMKQLLTDQQ